VGQQVQERNRLLGTGRNFNGKRKVGIDVIAQLEEQLPDVLVVDLGMPGVSGEEVIRYVQERQSAKRVKIVVVTGNHLASQSELADRVDLMLIKPVSPRDLVSFVKRFI